MSNINITVSKNQSEFIMKAFEAYEYSLGGFTAEDMKLAVSIGHILCPIKSDAIEAIQ